LLLCAYVSATKRRAPTPRAIRRLERRRKQPAWQPPPRSGESRGDWCRRPSRKERRS